ncbi:aspartate--tRNA ligase [Candidatus Uhrbacteria bacterium]|nr:aspartate--tRNA ligase [Candidatus Uhrbacteria bacterium]
MKRTNERTMIGETVSQVGNDVRVNGWVHARRDMGKIVFLDVRDRSGLLQVVCVPSELSDAAKKIVVDLRTEFCISVRGVVQKRGVKQVNPNLPTGEVEILAKDIEVYNPSKTPPFELDKDTREINEELRLKYRYLDLRSPRMLRNLILRDRVISFFRDFLHERDFVEVETPYLTKGTPEGAREFLVPSRLHPGEFYVLPQSPQQFKQLLMVGGIEKYFQIARCFRDEDQRGDRQPEFTQLDLEMSFVDREDILRLVEEMMIAMVKQCAPEKRIQTVPFPRLSYQEAMAEYGTDKPDLRMDKNDPNLLAFCWVLDFPFFEETEDGWTFSHNPFSAPTPEHMVWLLAKKNIGKILTTQYDIVLNGFEAGGGSIRNHRPEALRAVLEILGLSDKEIQTQFGHMLDAFAYGAPPHGGIAPGIDRIVMILANEPNIREVIAVPKTGDARDVMMGAPSVLPKKRLDEAHINLQDKQQVAGSKKQGKK